MEKIVKVTNENYPEIYNDKYEKYFLVNNNKDIIGLATIVYIWQSPTRI